MSQEIEDAPDEQGGVKAVETGMRLLVALSADVRPQMLKSLAERAAMHPAKAHRYLVSFLRSGLVQRDDESGLYRLGPLAIQVGAAALGSLNIVRAAANDIARLRDDVNITVALSVWGTHGPTNIFVEEANKLVVIKSALGTTFPLVTSATGRMFAAYLPQFLIQPLVEEELREMAQSVTARTKLRKEFDQILSQVRKIGMSQSLGSLSPGVHALCSPILDHRERLAAGLAVLAPAGEFDSSVTGAAAKRLREATRNISRLMGFHGTALDPTSE